MENLKTLIFIPTYNERGNVQSICEQILQLGLDTEILFLDDNSPDGTGEVLDELARRHNEVHVIHRSGKLGIGSAHIDGINWAYDAGVERLITMDCDFTHSPADIVKMCAASENCALVIGSRFLGRDTLPGWSLLRKLLTSAGHLLTVYLLGLDYDASGAFRIYDLTTLPRELFSLPLPKGYAFFFESLFVIVRNGFGVNQVPIVLPARTEGASKMSLKEMWRGVRRLLVVALLRHINPGRFTLRRRPASKGAPVEAAV